MFGTWQSLIEKQVEKAKKEGLMDNLKGKGRPLNLKSTPFTDEDDKMRETIYKSAGLLPPEVQSKKAIGDMEEKLKSETLTEEDKKDLKRKIQYETLKLNMHLDGKKRG